MGPAGSRKLLSNRWSRRRFVGAAAGIPITAALGAWGCSRKSAEPASAAVLSVQQAAALQRISYLLFPFPDIGDAPYESVATSIRNRSEQDAGTAAMVRDGLAALDSAGQLPWLELDESSQLAVLASVESDAFFQFMLNTTKSELFNDPTLWAHIGYDPNSPLNDIDWLGDE